MGPEFDKLPYNDYDTEMSSTEIKFGNENICSDPLFVVSGMGRENIKYSDIPRNNKCAAMSRILVLSVFRYYIYNSFFS